MQAATALMSENVEESAAKAPPADPPLAWEFSQGKILAKASGSLVVVGTGMTGPRHMTTEALDHITRAQKVFYDWDQSAAWIKGLNAWPSRLGAIYRRKTGSWSTTNGLRGFSVS
jgi:hypothetical protein